MDEQQQRIAEELAGEFHGELRFDETALEIYSCDASIYQIRPLGVAFPKHQDDVVTLAKYSSEFDIPLIGRGSGSGVAGGALGRGIIVDFSRHMKEIISISSETVRVQTGVVREHLNRALRSQGRYFAPDPSNSSVTTVGGMLAVDAGGSHAVRAGSTRDHVQQIETVLAGGEILSASLHADPLRIGVPGATSQLVHQLAMLLNEQKDLIRERQPPMIRNCSGYHVRSVLGNKSLNLPRLLVGSEGTLGLFTEATLHTTPIPANRGAALLLFGDLKLAINAVNAITSLQPSACDLLDRRLLSLARESDPRFEELIPSNAEAALLVEQTGFSDQQVRDRMREVLLQAKRIDSGTLVAAEAYAFDEVEFLWSLPYRVVPLLIKLQGETRPIPIVEDIAVPPKVLHEFLTKAQRVFQRHWVTASLYAHAASGQVHFRPFLPTPDSTNAGKMESLARELYEVAVACGGTISGEHGNGLARTAFIRSEYGPLYKVFQQVKEIFDPHNLMNPGKIISDDPHLTIRNLRQAPTLVTEPTELVPLQLNWGEKQFAEVTQRCNGCGACRVENSTTRMCPFFHLDSAEQASPRSKANLMRGLLTGLYDPKAFSTEEAREISSLCFNCKQCQIECPSNVDIPSIALEAKAQVVAAEGLTRADWILSRAHSFGALGCRLAPLANWALSQRWFRWSIEKLLGISQQRKLPAFSNKTFLQSHGKPHSKNEEADVVFFVDHFVNYHDPELGFAFLKVMQQQGIDVHIPPEQVSSGMAMISAGDLDAARELAEINVRILADLAREGKTIVCTEPTSAICLKHEYPLLLDHPDVQMIADQVMDAGSYLWKLHQGNSLTTVFSALPFKVAYHLPCHVKFLSTVSPLLELLNLIPELQVEQIEKGCSGMAGAYGITAQNFETSIKMGEGLIAEMQRPDLHAGISECSSCRMQMQQATSVPAIHPLKILAYASGLMPELETRLFARRRSKLVYR